MAVIRTDTTWRVDRSIRVPFLVNTLIISGSWLFLLIFFWEIQPEVPLFYTLPQPSDQLVNKAWLWFIPSVMTLIASIHFVIIQYMKDFEDLLVSLFGWSTVAVVALLALVMMRVVIVIT